MGKNILIINGNPDPAPERLSAALARAYADGARDGGHAVERLDVGALDFSIMRRASEFLTEPGEDTVTNARARILWANHLLFIFPIWLGGPPALLKAFIEQVARHEFALGANARGFPAAKLKGRTARVITTMGMPAAAYRLWFGAHGVKAFNRGILEISGVRPVRTSYFGGLTPERCEKAIARVRKMGRAAA